MTTLASTIHRGSRDATSSAQTLLGGLAAALLVPVLALAGLALPLPSSVYRLAADLAERADVLAVGFGAGRADADAEIGPATIGLSGPAAPNGRAARIRLTDSSSPNAAPPSARRRAAAVLPGGRPAAASPRTADTPRPSRPTAPTAPTATPAPAPAKASPPAAQPTGGAAPAPADTKAPAPSPHTDPAPTPAPPLGDTVDGTVGTVTETVDETVGAVEGTVEETVGTVEETVGTVEETVETVEDVVEQLPLPLPKPPKLPQLLP